MKKMVAVVLIAATFLGTTTLLTFQTIGKSEFAKPNGGMNDPPEGTGFASTIVDRIFAARPNGGVNDPPEGRGLVPEMNDQWLVKKPNGGVNDPPEGTG